jgi:hypothetical protein
MMRLGLRHGGLALLLRIKYSRLRISRAEGEHTCHPNDDDLHLIYFLSVLERVVRVNRHVTRVRCGVPLDWVGDGTAHALRREAGPLSRRLRGGCRAHEEQSSQGEPLAHRSVLTANAFFGEPDRNALVDPLLQNLVARC